VSQKILVLGANGKIGRLFCEREAAAGLPLRAMIRSEAQRDFFDALKIEVVMGDLEGEFEPVFSGCDRVVFTAGSGGHTGGDKTMLVDLYGAVRAVEFSEAHEIEHFVMVSAARVEVPLAAPAGMRHYMVAKKLANERLIASGVAHTILRPGRLTDEPATGQVRTDFASGSGFDISRENVALCILESLESRASRGRVVDLLDGETPISRIFCD
jgi:uncharacterized protein YbjT (DUF2867 family)